MPPRNTLLLTILLSYVPVRAHARPALVASFDDDAGDATGPGSYRKPGDSDITDGDFDLRRLVVRTDGDDVIFEVTIGAPFREPAVTARGTVTPLPLWNQIYLQNIDIYIDSDPTSTAGSSECIPGRRVAFPVGRTWKAAVVMTPQPGATRDIVLDALGDAGRRVVVPGNLMTRSRTVTARVPAAALGGRPARTWAYSVHVSGARWERSFDVADRVMKGKPQPNAFTMDVKPIAEAWAFGGAPSGNAHPRVIDVLLPHGTSQTSVLGAFDPKSGALARVPFVSLEVTSPRQASSPSPTPPAFVVVDVSEKTLTVRGVTSDIAPLMIGHVVDNSGAKIARFVVERILDGGFAAAVLDGEERIVPGATVTFTH